ncbi:hypothetical protein DICPUDRAFT_82685 [Dictyostelium purpureum]|uniref:Rad60/SUMO-like domain-containing protein n=1 Tax=Dictyostelium purpureum TaxID=5786 RepID=F0ZX92_DICPU|nr:uncharacterized protein DICPUDRAFT_82685 [Dictyostelium purpureum]EGC31442.1 hypothetical protein DICPUDRAFT_82685 [Dictyostelium purpureum]|eukprot:XP_003292041.1 hypothetical protein DICPUDRAFT_82685 [Dictyostelium purpureum]
MADDFADMFTYRGSLREEDVIDISDDEDDDEIVETFESFDNSKKRNKQPIYSTTKKFKKTNDRSITSSSGSNGSNGSNTLSISIDDDDDFNFVNSNNNYNVNDNNNSNNRSNNKQVFLLDDDEDGGDSDINEDSKPLVYTKTNLQSLLKQTSSNFSHKTNTTASNNNNNSFDTIYSSSPNTSGSIPTPKKKNDGIPLVIKLAGEANEKIIFYYDTELQKLLDLYCGKKNLDSKTAQFKLYGLPLDSKKTPRDLDLLDDDILEVTIKASEPAIPLDFNINTTSTTTTTTAAPVDDDIPKVILKVSYEKQQHKFKIGKSDPFSKLILVLIKKIGITLPADKKIVLRFDGMALNPSSTPEDEDMEDDFLIEAVLKDK